MEGLPFDPYDFFGYLASGLLVVVGMELVLGFPVVVGQDLKLVELALLVLAVYVAGQMVATPSKALLEDLLVGRVLDRPSVNLLRAKKPRFRSLLFPGFYRPLPPERRSRILRKVKEEEGDTTGEGLFLHVRYHPEILVNERLIARLSSFLNKYGFSRNLAFASLLVGAVLLLKGPGEPPDPTRVQVGWTALVSGVLLLYRYLKFFRQYSYELLNTYAGLPDPSVAATATDSAAAPTNAST